MAKSAKQSAKQPTESFNPFFVALNGITNLFSKALSVGIVILLIGAIGSMTANTSRGDTPDDPSKIASQTVEHITSLSAAEIATIGGITLVILLFSLVVGAMLHGISSYTAMRLARGEETNIREAFSNVIERFGSYLVLYVWMGLKIFLWTLLFIIPGIIAYYRYAFAGIVFFDKDLHHEQAIKESRRLTHKGRMTLFSSDLLFNMITLGYISNVISLASRSELYREYTALDKAKQQKPGVHWLSWLTLALPFIIVFALIFLAIALAVVIGVGGHALTK